ncbi:MAG: penicillin-insensitive murein endopeptidase [bacterium]
MSIDTLMPESGTGFVSNNRAVNTHFGQASTIAAILNVAAAWNETHPTLPISIGQISHKGGGPMPPHKSHKLGIDVDLRPLRQDGANAAATITDPQYDQEKTTELIRLWWKKAPVQAIFFNDSEAIKQRLSRFVDGHHNHFHVRLRTKGATIRIGDRGSDVAEVQTKLGIGADGEFGDKTEHAVELFQEAHGLPPNGVVGPATWTALG